MKSYVDWNPWSEFMMKNFNSGLIYFSICTLSSTIGSFDIYIFIFFHSYWYLTMFLRCPMPLTKFHTEPYKKSVLLIYHEIIFRSGVRKLVLYLVYPCSSSYFWTNVHISNSYFTTCFAHLALCQNSYVLNINDMYAFMCWK